MESYWAAMEWFERIYWIIAVPFSVIFIIQLILSFVGADADVDADFDGDLDSGDGMDGDASPHFQVFSIRNFITFLTIFGWSGIMMIGYEVSKPITVLVSTLLGLFVMFLFAGLFYLFARMVENGTMDTKKAIGAVGEVYIPIKKNRTGVGRVQVNIQGTMREMQALTDESEDLTTSSVVQVIQIINENILLVKKV